VGISEADLQALGRFPMAEFAIAQTLTKLKSIGQKRSVWTCTGIGHNNRGARNCWRNCCGIQGDRQSSVLGMVLTGAIAHTKSFTMRAPLTVLPNQIASFLAMTYSGMFGAGDRKY
jgi:hypothetical protein